MTTPTEENAERPEAESDSCPDSSDPGAHLAEIDEACGCAELWEALSEHRLESDQD